MSSFRPSPPDEDPLGLSLERGLQREPLTDEALGRIRASVEAEFQALAHRARRLQVVRWTALAAALAILVVGGALRLRSAPHTPLLAGTIERVDSGALSVRLGLFQSHAASSGELLHTGERWVATGSVVITLASGGTLRMAPGTSIEATRPNQMELFAGRAYLDFAPGTAAFALDTPLGSIEHVGTQFEAAIVEDNLRVRVREGTVRVFGASSTVTAEKGTELSIPPTGAIVRRPIPTYGPEWAWVDALAPDYDIENKPLIDFLSWVGRETGRRVDFADEHVRAVARETLLHGSVQGLKPLDALDRVLSTTSLRFELQGDSIRVSSRR